MKKFLVNKDSFVEYFLKPLSVFDLPDKCCRISCEDTFRGITYTNDRNCIVDITLKDVESENFEPVILRDINRIVSAISYVSEPKMGIQLYENYMLYDSDSIKFKSFFLENTFFDSKIIQKIDKIKSLDKDTSFILQSDSLSKIKKSKNFAKSTDKVYFTYDNEKVFASRKDIEKSNIDTISFMIAETCDGESFNEIPIHISVFDLIQDFKSSILVEVNKEYGIIQFTIENDKTKLEYITSALRK